MIIKPGRIGKGSTAGIFTPSSPANVLFKDKFEHAVSELERAGFKVKLGELTKKMTHQGYRSGTPLERAREFMGLIEDGGVDFLMSSIGGYNSSSMIPFLDYDLIRKKRKIITGFSDVTSLHMAILTKSKLSTFYGPALIPTFGEWPGVLDESLESFRRMASKDEDSKYELPLFPRWSNHFRDAKTDEWKTTDRKYNKNTSPTVLSEGTSEAPIIAANLNTLCSLAGSEYFPVFNGEILLLEEMQASFDEEERNLTQLKLMGVFDAISGLVVGKPEFLDARGAPFSYEELILEVTGKRDYPVITSFDCGHTHPMHTIPQMAKCLLDTGKKGSMLSILESVVS